MSTTNSVGNMRTIKILSLHQRQHAALNRRFLSSCRAWFRLRRMPQQIPFPKNKVQVAAINKQPARLAENEHGIPFVNRIGEKNDAAGHAAVPEGKRNNAAAFQ